MKDIHGKMLVLCRMIFIRYNGIGGFVYVRLGDRWGYVDEDGNFVDEDDEDKMEGRCLLSYEPEL